MLKYVKQTRDGSRLIEELNIMLKGQGIDPYRGNGDVAGEVFWLGRRRAKRVLRCFWCPRCGKNEKNVVRLKKGLDSTVL